jgi:hypothetical protein
MTIKTPPLAFTQDNFCAVLNSIKTETRRLLTLKDVDLSQYDSIYLTSGNDPRWVGFKEGSPRSVDTLNIKPKYAVGDRCYLTEPTRIVLAPDQSLYYQIEYFWHDPKTIQKLITIEDREKIAARKKGIYKETPARFMLKSFARYWVEITDVRVERLLDITEEAAIAEGIKSQPRWYDAMTTDYFDYCKGRFVDGLSPIDSYLSEIAYIHKDRGGWDLVKSDPWVWVYKFKLVTP